MSAHSCGRRCKYVWTSEELEKLRELWGEVRDAELAKILGKSVSVVRLKATTLDLRSKKGRRVGCRPGNVTFPWSKEEDLILVKNVGHVSIFELLELLPRRNRVSIERHCYLMGFSPTQGTYTRGKVERETGYDWRQIRRARDALGQTWKRYGLRKYMISFDQVQEIIEYLRTEKRKWSKQYGLDKCIKCGAHGGSERERHSGEGLCKRCVTGDTRILVKNRGIVRIDEMLGQEFEVWSGKNWQKTQVEHRGRQHVIGLHFSNGEMLRLTPDHEVLTRDGMVRADLLSGYELPAEVPVGICAEWNRAGDVHVTYTTDLGRSEDVYDLVNVGDEHQFVANGISVSNCWDRRRHVRSWVAKIFLCDKVICLTLDVWEGSNAENATGNVVGRG